MLIFKGGLAEQEAELCEALHTLLSALDQVVASAGLAHVLHTALALGNALNSGRRPPARGMRVASLRRLADTRSVGGATTLLHYLAALLARHAPEVSLDGAGQEQGTDAALLQS